MRGLEGTCAGVTRAVVRSRGHVLPVVAGAPGAAWPVWSRGARRAPGPQPCASPRAQAPGSCGREQPVMLGPHTMHADGWQLDQTRAHAARPMSAPITSAGGERSGRAKASSLWSASSPQPLPDRAGSGRRTGRRGYCAAILSVSPGGISAGARRLQLSRQAAARPGSQAPLATGQPRQVQRRCRSDTWPAARNGHGSLIASLNRIRRG